MGSEGAAERQRGAPDNLSAVLEQVSVIRYVTPLREGGSLPALVEADNLCTYVMKFRGAGQGPKALVAEIIGGELARRLGLRTPELVLGYLDPRIASSEPDPEIQDLLRASSGLNVGVDFLPGSAGFDTAGWDVGPDFASQVLWFDALIQNVDRTWRNPNLLVWHGDIWLIDHNAALYFHHKRRRTGSDLRSCLITAPLSRYRAVRRRPDGGNDGRLRAPGRPMPPRTSRPAPGRHPACGCACSPSATGAACSSAWPSWSSSTPSCGSGASSSHHPSRRAWRR
jgi:HipA-like kinase